MPFSLVPAVLYQKLAVCILAGLFILVVMFLDTDRNMPGGKTRNIFQGVIFSVFLGYLLPAMAILPVSPPVRLFLFHLGSFWFSALPLVTCKAVLAVIPVQRKRIPIFLPALVLLVLQVFIPRFSPYLLFFVFLPAWVASLYDMFREYRLSLNPGTRRILFHGGFLVFLTGGGFFLDTLIVPNIVEIPLFTLGIPLWGLYSFTRELRGKHPGGKDPRISEAVPYLLVPILVLTAAGIRSALNLTLAGSPTLPYPLRNEMVIIGGISAGMTVLFFVFTPALASFVTTLSERYMSPLDREILHLGKERGRNLSPDFLNEILTRVSDIRGCIWVRKRNGREYQPVGSPCPPFDPGDVFVPEMEWNRSLETHGYHRIYPGSILNSNPFHTAGDKLNVLLEKSELLLLSCSSNNLDKFPPALVTLYREAGKLTSREIRTLGQLVPVLEVLTHTFREKFFIKLENAGLKSHGDPDNTPGLPEAVRVILEHARRILVSWGVTAVVYPEQHLSPGFQLPVCFSWDENSGVSRLEEFPDYGSFTMEKPDEAGLYAGAVESSAGDSCRVRILTIPMVSCRGYILFRVWEDTFIYETDDRENLAKFAEQAGLNLDLVITRERVRFQAEEMEIIARQAEDQVLDEKLSLAASLHDTIAQEIFAARMQIELLQRQMAEASPETREDLKLLQTTVSEGFKQVREMIRVLKSRESSVPAGSPEELERFLERIRRETNMEFHFTGLPLLRDFAGDRLGEVVMIIRESVNNIRKHARASRCVLRVRRRVDSQRKTGFSILILDDGKGFDRSGSFAGSFGLSSIDLRCRKLGGTWRIRSIPGRGTALLFVIPA